MAALVPREASHQDKHSEQQIYRQIGTEIELFELNFHSFDSFAMSADVALKNGFLQGQALPLTRNAVPFSDISAQLMSHDRLCTLDLGEGATDQSTGWDSKSTGKAQVISRRADRLVLKVVHADPSCLP